MTLLWTNDPNPYIRLLTATAAAKDIDIVFFPGVADALVEDFDIVHMHFPIAWAKPNARSLLRAVSMMGLWRVRGVKVVRTVHDLEANRPLPWWVKPVFHALERGDVRIYLTEYSRAEAQDADGVVIKHGHYREFMLDEPTPAKAPEPTVITFGHIRWYRGVGDLVDAFAELPPDSDIQLRIVGSPDPPDAADAVIAKAGVLDRVTVKLGYATDSDLWREAGRATLTVMPFRWITNSGAVIFSLSAGTPVLMPDLPLTRELAAEFGSYWVRSYEPPLTGAILERHVADVWARQASEPVVPMEGWDWLTHIGPQHAEVYRSVGRRRPPLGWGFDRLLTGAMPVARWVARRAGGKGYYPAWMVAVPLSWRHRPYPDGEDEDVLWRRVGDLDVGYWNPCRREPRYLNVGPRVNNFGDLLGPRVVSLVTGHKAGKPRRLGADELDAAPADRPALRLFAVGSILHMAHDGDTIWGVGVNPKGAEDSYRAKTLDVRAVRGPLTRQFLLSRDVDCPEVYGDPALLLGLLDSDLQRCASAKRYHLTVIPNLEDFGSMRSHPCAIDPRTNLHAVLRRIAQSDMVVGSSLHAVVVAESLGIPAALVESAVEPRLKYDDYYQGTGRESAAIAPTVDEAVGLITRRDSRVEQGIAAWSPAPLLAAFPGHLALSAGVGSS
jgi:pyruvyltransferase